MAADQMSESGEVCCKVVMVLKSKIQVWNSAHVQSDGDAGEVITGIDGKSNERSRRMF